MWNHGRIHHCINVGCSGDTSEDLINRFENDVAGLYPDIIFIKIGGNDSDYEAKIEPERFKENIENLVFKLSQMGSRICLMTYHSPNLKLYGARRAEKLFKFMEIIRDIAKSKETYLIDTLPVWEALRKNYPLIHKSMLLDEIHLNRLGNLFLGIIITKDLGLTLVQKDEKYWARAQKIYNLVHKG